MEIKTKRILVGYSLVLAAFEKIAKSDSYMRHVRLSVRMERLGSHWTDFDEICHLCFFRKSVEQIQVSLNSDKNNAYLYDDIFTLTTSR